MGKTSLFFTSLVAAIPAGFLCYVLTMGFLQHAEDLETMVQVLAALGLAVGAFVAVIPIGVLLFTPGTAQPETEQGEAGQAADSDAEIDVDVEDDDEIEMDVDEEDLEFDDD